MNINLSARQRLLVQIALILLFITPLSLWYISQPLAVWQTAPGVLRSIGHLCGIIGALFFSYNFILSARISWIEEIFNGLPKVYSLHHLFGGIALILLLVHPVFLGLQYLPNSISAAASFYLPDIYDIPKMMGVIALGILTSLLCITFFVRIAYHNWKATHQWLGLALVFASLHVYLMPGHLDSAPWLRGYMIVMMVLGLTAFTYRVLLGRWLVRRYPYIVDNIRVYGNTATEVRLLPLQKSISRKAGQFFFIQVHNANNITRETHPFSFTSNASRLEVTFAAKIVGDYTSTLPQLRKGMRVDLEGPYGRFILDESEGEQVWIAGGIGITPFMSKIRELQKNTLQKIHLYYLVRSTDQALFAQEIVAIAQKVPSFTVEIWESKTKDKFTVKNIEDFNTHKAKYYICGPEEMMVSLRQQMKDNQIPDNRIYTEEFKLY